MEAAAGETATAPPPLTCPVATWWIPWYNAVMTETQPDECPAGGPHDYDVHDSGDAYGPIGGGPGTVVHHWVACSNCGAPPPPDDDGPRSTRQPDPIVWPPLGDEPF